MLTFGLHQRLPYKRLLIITGGLLLAVLFVMVGEEVNEMQLAGWIGTTTISSDFPGWAGTWFSLFANVQTIVAQVVAVAIVLGSYVAAQYLRVWRHAAADGPPRGSPTARRCVRSACATSSPASAEPAAPTGGRGVAWPAPCVCAPSPSRSSPARSSSAPSRPRPRPRPPRAGRARRAGA